jgi:DNA-binding NtrC family response regulator
MRVLVIDDDPDDLENIVEALQNSQGPDNQNFDVEEASNDREAIEKLDKSLDDKTKKPFDIVIVDMQLGSKGDEGIEIIKRLSGKSSVAIVFTHVPEISNCVEAMKAGAWDYIEKKTRIDRADHYKRLRDSIHKAYERFKKNPERGIPNPDSEWVHKNFNYLMKKYPGKLVAVLYEKEIDSDIGFAELAKRVESKFPLARPTIVSIPEPSEGDM